MRSVGSVVAVAALTCGGLAADDKWETSPGFFPDDHPVGTPNQLIHGALQTHDIEGRGIAATLTDQDFSYVRAKARHSDGTYGALAGKAVALEPSTGFTFDTLIAPIPY
jgi:hypothetical protein